MPESVELIGSRAFSFCTNLTNIVIPHGVISIEKFMFAGCSSLISIVIPSSVTLIDYWAFNYCDSLSHILYCATSEMWDGIDKDEAKISTEALVTYNYCEGMDYHVYDDNKDANCNSCGQFRIIGCVGQTLGIEVTTNVDYAFKLMSECSENVAVKYTGQSSIVIGASGRYCKGYELVFSEPGSYELTFVQETTGNKVVFAAEIFEHSWEFNVKCSSTCTEDGYDLYICSYCESKEHRNITKSTGHIWDDGQITQGASCKDMGIMTYSCNICKETKTETIARLTSHIYDHACDIECNICGVTRTTFHVPGEAATNTTDQVCMICGTILTPATGKEESTVSSEESTISSTKETESVEETNTSSTKEPESTEEVTDSSMKETESTEETTALSTKEPESTEEVTDSSMKETESAEETSIPSTKETESSHEDTITPTTEQGSLEGDTEFIGIEFVSTEIPSDEISRTNELDSFVNWIVAATIIIMIGGVVAFFICKKQKK